MRPPERRETGEQDLFRSRLDQIIDMKHALVKLARTIDWRFLEQRFGAVYDDDPGRPPLPTRLMAGLAILKHIYDLSDEVLCERWVENPYYQLFCGEEFFQHRLPFDRSSLTRWRQRMGEERLVALLQESLSVASQDQGDQAVRAVAGDRRHHGSAQERDVPDRCQADEPGAREAGAAGTASHGVGLAPVLCAGGQVRPDQASALCPRQAVQARQPGAQELRTYLGRVIRDIGRKIEGNSGLEAAFAQLLALARRVREQQQRQRGPKVYSLHAPEVECIGKGKAHKPYEFGVKVSRRHHAQPRQGRPVRHPCEGAARQSL